MVPKLKNSEWFRLYRYGMHLTNGNKEDTKDLVQEALCMVMEKVHLESRKFSIPYVKKVMRNLFIDEQRREGIFTNREIPEDIPEVVVDESEKEKLEQIHNAIKEHKYGALFIEKAENGLTFSQLAERTNIKAETLKKRIQKLYADIWDQLGKDKDTGNKK